jgi:uncharacterized protein YdbL (DUF1318 family)
MHTIRLSSLLGLLLFATACVTINVYFPTAEAVEAADRIILDVYGKDSEPESKPSGGQTPDSSLYNPATGRPLFVGLLEWLVQPASAAADVNIQSPAIRTIRASMEKRFKSLKPFYGNGAIGMTRDGLLKVRDLKAIELRDRKKVKTLVADENRDRNALYKEIARANKQPEWEADIRKTFARRWVDNAPGGWWYQDKGGNWKQK